MLFPSILDDLVGEGEVPVQSPSRARRPSHRAASHQAEQNETKVRSPEPSRAERNPASASALISPTSVDPREFP